jgi:hypothetical protein
MIIFFGFVGCPTPDAPPPKTTTSSVFAKSQIGNDTADGEGTSFVPEPITLILLGSGLVGLAVFGRKKFKK